MEICQLLASQGTMLKSGSALVSVSYMKPMSLIEPSVCAKIGSIVSADATAPTRNCPP